MGHIGLVAVTNVHDIHKSNSTDVWSQSYKITLEPEVIKDSQGAVIYFPLRLFEG